MLDSRRRARGGDGGVGGDAMTPKQKKTRADLLAAKRFQFYSWVGREWRGEPDLSCGTTACMAGWATTLPRFKKRGLKLRRYLDGTNGIVSPGLDDSWSAICRTFGLEAVEAAHLFSPDYDFIIRHSPPAKSLQGLGGNATPKQAARHLRRFVRVVLEGKEP